MSRVAVADYLAGDTSCLVTRKNSPLDGTEPLVIALHGASGLWKQWAPGAMGVPCTSELGWITRTVVDAGFVVYSIDCGSGTADPWGNDTAVSAISAAITTAQGYGARTGKVGLLGYSMGGLNALNYLTRNLTSVFATVLFDPVTDLDTFQANVSFQTAINMAYGGNYAANAVGHKPYSFAATLRGGPPVRIYQGSADTTVTPTQTAGFVAAVNDPAVTSISVGGTHGTCWTYVPPTDVAVFLTANLA